MIDASCESIRFLQVSRQIFLKRRQGWRAIRCKSDSGVILGLDYLSW